MKRIKVAFALLAIIFAVTTSFTVKEVVKVDDRTLTYQWFDYDGSGDITLASNYVYSGVDPQCNNTFKVCGIKVLADQTTHAIDATDFASLKTASTNFTVAGTYGSREVDEEPQTP